MKLTENNTTTTAQQRAIESRDHARQAIKSRLSIVKLSLSSWPPLPAPIHSQLPPGAISQEDIDRVDNENREREISVRYLKATGK